MTWQWVILILGIVIPFIAGAATLLCILAWKGDRL